MPDNFNDTLDNIKESLEAAEHHFTESENTGSVTYAEREMQRANMIFNRTAAMNAVFQTEVLLVIADALTRIADAMEAADEHDPPNDYRIFNRRQADGTFRPLSEFFDNHD